MFHEDQGSPDFWKCGSGKILKQVKATGWTNLAANIVGILASFLNSSNASQELSLLKPMKYVTVGMQKTDLDSTRRIFNSK